MSALRKLLALARRDAARSRCQARLYVRVDCHLCDEAAALVDLARRRGAQIELERIDIEADPALLRRYLLSIPVLELVGRSRLEWPFSLADLERALR